MTKPLPKRCPKHPKPNKETSQKSGNELLSHLLREKSQENDVADRVANAESASASASQVRQRYADREPIGLMEAFLEKDDGFVEMVTTSGEADGE